MKKIQYILILGLLLVMAGCEKDTEPANFAPKMTTGDVSDIYRVGATLSGTIQKTEGNIIKECGVLYSTIQSMAEYEQVTIPLEEAAAFTIPLQGLKPGTTYYYCTYASSGRSIAKGEIKSFSTVANSAPLFNVLILEALDEQSMTLSTTIKDAGGSEVTVRGFCWKLAEDDNKEEPTLADNLSNVPLEELVFSSKISGLEPSKPYLVRAYAVNGVGVGYGETLSLTTTAATVPVVSKITQTASTPLSVTVESTLISNGEMPIIEKGFCWSAETEEPTIAHIKKVVKGDENKFSVLIDELKPVTAYHIRAYATNALGTGYSETFTYTTPLNIADLDVTTITEIKPTTAKAVSVIISENGSEVTERGFCLSKTNKEPTIENSKVVVNATTATYSSVLTNLDSGTTYYIRSYATNSKGTGYGKATEFTTAVDLSITTVSAITDNEASVSAEIVTASKEFTITEKGFCYSTTNAVPTVADVKKTSSASGNAITVKLSELTGNTKYYICAYAVNAKGTYYGPVKEFTTKEGVSIAATSVTNITQASALASSEIISDAGKDVLEKGFCFSASNSNPTATDRRIVSKAEGNMITATIDGLSSNLKCYVCGYVKNARGYHYGKVTSFNTSAEKAGTPIDIGLSVKWADYNVGASSVEDYGGLYGWGDPTGTVTSPSGNYPGVNAGGEISGTEYDIARTKWGDSWRMPTKAEMEEFIDKCIRTDIERNGIKGTEFVGPNGRMIFLPKSGIRNDLQIEFQGEYGNYWTGTGSSFHWPSRWGELTGANHYSGLSVRPISDFVTVGVTSVSSITGVGASLSSKITSNEGLTITEKGFCYNMYGTPTITDDREISTTSGNDIKVSLSGLVPYTKYYVRAYATNSRGGTVYGAKQEFYTQNKYPVGEPVDLGLSVKWANFNMGASKPEEYGGLYYWADGTGVGQSVDVDRDLPEFIGGTENDIAHVKWGSDWRLPTVDEINELISSCTLYWTKQGGINGLLVTGPNGKSIFLPAAGEDYPPYWGKDDDRRMRGKLGIYLSDKLWKQYKGNCYVLSFDETLWEWRTRGNGLKYSVRPVTK